MSSINVTKFFSWLKSKSQFVDHDVRGQKKILVNSPWAEDTKKHLGIFPYRGKHGRFRDFKTDRNGNLYELVMDIDHCTFREACQKIGNERGISDPLGSQLKVDTLELGIARHKEKSISNFELPTGTIPVHPSDQTPEIQRAVQYLRQRYIEPLRHEVFYCTQNRRSESGRFQMLKGRVLFTFYNHKRRFVYWSARTMEDDKIKYLEPLEEEVPVNKDEILYTPRWDFRNKEVLLCEGMIDAISIWETGFSAASVQGSELYAGQKMILKKMKAKPILAFDRDKAGMRAMVKSFKRWGSDQIGVVLPPAGHKDWNSAIIDMGPDKLSEYISSSVQLLHEEDILTLEAKL